MVSTSDFESGDPSSNLGRTSLIAFDTLMLALLNTLKLNINSCLIHLNRVSLTDIIRLFESVSNFIFRT